MVPNKILILFFILRFQILLNVTTSVSFIRRVQLFHPRTNIFCYIFLNLVNDPTPSKSLKITERFPKVLENDAKTYFFVFFLVDSVIYELVVKN